MCVVSEYTNHYNNLNNIPFQLLHYIEHCAFGIFYGFYANQAVRVKSNVLYVVWGEWGVKL